MVQTIEILRKSPLEFVQIKFLAMYISKKKLTTFTKSLHGTWSLFNALMIFGIKEKSIIFWLLLQIYPERLKTGFVLQGHIYIMAFLTLIITII